MSFDAAVVREQGVSFAVVVVKGHVLSSQSSREEALGTFAAKFPGVRIVLMTQGSKGRPTFWGRSDIVRFLSKVPLSALPWRRWS